MLKEANTKQGTVLRTNLIPARLKTYAEIADITILGKVFHNQLERSEQVEKSTGAARHATEAVGVVWTSI